MEFLRMTRRWPLECWGGACESARIAEATGGSIGSVHALHLDPTRRAASRPSQASVGESRFVRIVGGAVCWLVLAHDDCASPTKCPTKRHSAFQSNENQQLSVSEHKPTTEPSRSSGTSKATFKTLLATVQSQQETIQQLMMQLHERRRSSA